MAKKQDKFKQKIAQNRSDTSPAAPMYESSYELANMHEEEAQKHETVAQYHIAHGKANLGNKHRAAAEKFMLAASYYRKASGRPSRYSNNHQERAEEIASEAHSFVEDNGLHLDEKEGKASNKKDKLKSFGP